MQEIAVMYEHGQLSFFAALSMVATGMACIDSFGNLPLVCTVTYGMAMKVCHEADMMRRYRCTQQQQYMHALYQHESKRFKRLYRVQHLSVSTQAHQHIYICQTPHRNP